MKTFIVLAILILVVLTCLKAMIAIVKNPRIVEQNFIIIWLTNKVNSLFGGGQSRGVVARAAEAAEKKEEEQPLEESDLISIYLLFPLVGYAIVFSLSNTVIVQAIDLFRDEDIGWLNPGSLLAVIITAYYVYWSRLQYWVFTYINIGAIIKWRWGTRKRIAKQKVVPKAWIFEDVQKDADRKLDNQPIKVTVTLPTLGAEGVPGPSMVITATILRKEEGKMSHKTISFSEEAIQEGTEGIITETIQKEVAMIPLDKFNERWSKATVGPNQERVPSLVEKLAFAFTGDKITTNAQGETETTDGDSAFEKLFGQHCTSAKFTYAPEAELQAIIDAGARGDEVSRQARAIQVQGGKRPALDKDKKPILDDAGNPVLEYIFSLSEARHQAMIIMGLITEKSVRTNGKGGRGNFLLHENSDEEEGARGQQRPRRRN